MFATQTGLPGRTSLLSVGCTEEEVAYRFRVAYLFSVRVRYRGGSIANSSRCATRPRAVENRPTEPVLTGPKTDSNHFLRAVWHRLLRRWSSRPIGYVSPRRDDREERASTIDSPSVGLPSGAIRTTDLAATVAGADREPIATETRSNRGRRPIRDRPGAPVDARSGQGRALFARSNYPHRRFAPSSIRWRPQSCTSSSARRSSCC